MRPRRLGTLEVSAVGLGCNQFGRKIDAGQTERVVHAAIAEGITFFDTSDRYGYGNAAFSGFGRSEEYLGRAIRRRRDQVIIGTKFGLALADNAPTPGAGRDYVVKACEGSLRRLGTDHIDLYQLHRPDPHTPVDETLAALAELLAQGKVREIGWCNVTADDIVEADDAATRAGVRRFAGVQNEYSLLERSVEQKVLPTCVERGISFVPYFPLAGGLLTGKYNRTSPPEDARLTTFPPNRPHLGLTDTNLHTVEALSGFATDAGRSLLELAVSWLLAQPAITSVIAGATRPEQAQANFLSGNWRLTADELRLIDDILFDVEAAGRVNG